MRILCALCSVGAPPPIGFSKRFHHSTLTGDACHLLLGPNSFTHILHSCTLARARAIRVDDAGVKRLRIEAAGASRSFEVGDAGFKKPKGSIVNLEIPLKSGDAIGFRLALGDDGRSVKVTPEIVKTGGNYRNIFTSNITLRSKFWIFY